MNTYLTVILTHEQLALCLQKTIEKILGKQKNLYAYTNLVDTLPLLAKKIEEKINVVKPVHSVCFVDLAGGSCWSLANMLRKKNPALTIISGVNMPMLVSYFTNMNDLDYPALMEKVIKDASRGIVFIEGAS